MADCHSFDSAARNRSVQRHCQKKTGCPQDADSTPLRADKVRETEGAGGAGRAEGWHRELVGGVVAAGRGLFPATRRLVAATTDPSSTAAATAWWESLTASGGEGMVVKPLAGLVTGQRGLVQPGLKVRGREYLRIIYGPDYIRPEHLERLRQRGLGRKRSMRRREDP